MMAMGSPMHPRSAIAERHEDVVAPLDSEGMGDVAGETLRDRLQAGRLPFAEALRLAGEVAETIEAAHEQGVVHRDLEPANIVLTRQGHVAVVDPGATSRGSRPAGPEAAPLVPDYMSPEQARGLPPDPRSAQFSFGVILAEMVAGHRPFRRRPAADVSAAAPGEPPDLGGEVPPRLKPLLRRLMAADPDDRFASMAEVRAELARLSQSFTTRPPRRAPEEAHVWRLPTWAWLAILLVPTALLILWWSGVLSAGPAS
jgi:serine/threonine protein kinase